MLKQIAASLLAVAAMVPVIGSTGCDRTISEEQSVERKPDGTVVKESEKTTRSPDGTSKTTSERKVEPGR